MTNHDDKKSGVQDLAESGTDQERLRAKNEKNRKLIKVSKRFWDFVVAHN